MKFGLDRGKSLSSGSVLLNLPKKFWMTFIGAVGVLIFTLFNWYSFDWSDFDWSKVEGVSAGGIDRVKPVVGFNLFTAILRDSYFGNLMGHFYGENFMMVLMIAMIFAFILIIISLITHQSKAGAVFTYCGFGLSALVPIIFMIVIMALNEHTSVKIGSGLTVFPFLTCVLSIVVFLSELPQPRNQRADMLHTIRPENMVIFTYMALPVLVYIFAVFFPLLSATFYSFFTWQNGPHKTLNGMGNYVRLMRDTTFWQSFGHNIFLVAACIVGQIGIAFVFVLMIDSRLVRLKGLHRTFGFFPSTVAAVSIGFIWVMIYDYNRGLINWFLTQIEKYDAVQVWLNNPKKVLIWVAIPLVWQFIGYYMIIILSAIAAVDEEIFEVAKLDGANAIQRAIYIVLPLIKNTLLVCVTLCIAGNMKVFDHIFVMTEGGGPGTASMVMALWGYRVSFWQGNMGYGSAISIGIFILSLMVILGTQSFVNSVMKDKGVE